MTRAPHVLVLGTVLGQGHGGVRRHNAELLPRAARLLRAEGGSLAVLEGATPIAFELPEEIERLQADIPARPVLRRAMVEGGLLREVLAQRASEGRPFDLVHTAHQPAPRRLDVPLSLLIHDLRALELAHSPFSRRLFARGLIGRAASRAAVVCTVSEAMAVRVAEALGLVREDVRVVPNAADHATPLPRQVAGDAPLLCVGHLEARKRPELLLRALAVDPSLPPAVFAGAEKGGERTRLEALAAELGVRERVRFLGPIDDGLLREQYASCAAVVCPSALEGFGIVPLEAQRARAPLAISAIPAHLEVAGAEVPRFEDDPDECARAIRAALAQDDAALESAARAAARYSWDDSAERLVAAWRSVARPK